MASSPPEQLIQKYFFYAQQVNSVNHGDCMHSLTREVHEYPSSNGRGQWKFGKREGAYSVRAQKWDLGSDGRLGNLISPHLSKSHACTCISPDLSSFAVSIKEAEC